MEWAYLLAERLTWLLAGGCLGIVVEWRWHPFDRALTWLEYRWGR